MFVVWGGVVAVQSGSSLVFCRRWLRRGRRTQELGRVTFPLPVSVCPFSRPGRRQSFLLCALVYCMQVCQVCLGFRELDGWSLQGLQTMHAAAVGCVGPCVFEVLACVGRLWVMSLIASLLPQLVPLLHACRVGGSFCAPLLCTCPAGRVGHFAMGKWLRLVAAHSHALSAAASPASSLCAAAFSAWHAELLRCGEGF